MLLTSIAAVILGCFYFCPLDCDIPAMVVDCAAVETGCMVEKYKMVAHLQCYKERGYIRTPAVLLQKGIYTYLVRILFFFIFLLMRYIPTSVFFTLGRSVFA